MTNTNLPKDWQWKKLEEVCKFQNGFAFKSELFKNNGFPILRISNIQERELTYDDLVYFDLDDYTKNLDAYKVFPNEMVIAMSGATSGKIGINNTQEVWYLNQRVGKFVLDDENKKKYLFYFLSTKIEENLKNSFGSAIPNLSSKQIEEIQIPLPPLAEQQRIVAKLDAAFEQLEAAIALQKQNLQRTETLKKALLVEQFGELKYEKKKLGELAAIGTGSTPLTSKKEFYENGNIVWITSSSTNELFVKTPEKFISEKALKETNCKVYPVGTLIIALYGQGKTRGQITELCIEAATNQACAAIILKEKSIFHRKFVKYFFLKSYTQLREMSSGGTQENLNLNKIKTTEIPLPPLAEQEKIVAYLDKTFAEIDALLSAQKARLEHLAMMKKAILQEAFEGKL